MFDPVTMEAIRNEAETIGIDVPALLAVCEVESGGAILAMVDGRPEPLIRFEGHWFHRLLPRSKRPGAIAAGLASPKPGAVANPRSQVRRWALVRRAMEIDREAALSATSWGIGQVMGVHWRWLGFASVDDLVARARSGGVGQVAIMVRYIDRSGLAGFLRERDWAGFARCYNGPGYRKHRYDVRMAEAHARHVLEEATGSEPFLPGRHVPLLLRPGARGEAVRQLQRELVQCGHSLAVDGDFGPATRAAVKAFQERMSLKPDGMAGPATFEALQRLQPRQGKGAG